MSSGKCNSEEYHRTWYHYTLISMAKIWSADNTSAGKYVEQKLLSFIAVGMQNVTATGKTVWWVFKNKTKHTLLPHNPAIALLGI